MRVSFCNYERMNEFLRHDIQEELGNLLSFDDDDSLYKYRYREERRIGKVLGKWFFIGTNSGTSALQLSLAALGIGAGDEVITVPNTFIATALAISNTGARPVFVDIGKENLLLDIDQVENSITERTKAILPVHLYGQMVDMNRLRRIVKKHGLGLVEDAAHAHLARFDGKLPGSLSDAACYSFHINKNLGGIGAGGMAITRSWGLYRKLEALRNPTSNSQLLMKSLRTPAFLSWIEIIFLNCKIRHIDVWTKKRREIAKTYYEGLKGLPIQFQATDKRAYHVYRDFVILSKKRDKLQKYLRRKGIGTAIRHPMPIHLTRTYQHLHYHEGDFPVSERASSQVLSLPINPFLNDDETEYVIKTIKSFFIK